MKCKVEKCTNSKLANQLHSSKQTACITMKVQTELQNSQIQNIQTSPKAVKLSKIWKDIKQKAITKMQESCRGR